MSYIHFKWIYNSNFETIKFVGPSLPFSLVKKIIELKFINDIEIINFDNNQSKKIIFFYLFFIFNFFFLVLSEHVPKNTRLIVKRNATKRI